MALSRRAQLLIKLERYFPPHADVLAKVEAHGDYEFAKAESSYRHYVEELGDVAGKHVLDFGCGWGGESLWLTQHARHVTGCDVNPQAIEGAQPYAQSSQNENLDFALCGDRSLPFESDSFDAVFSTNAFEHVMTPQPVLSEICRVLKPGGSFVSTFGPLFHGPLGYHMPWTTQVPWAHVLGGLKTMMEVRNTKRAPIHPASWRDIGLNMMTFAQFRDAARTAGLEAHRLRRIAVRNQRWLAAMPFLGKYFTFGIDCHLKKPGILTSARGNTNPQNREAISLNQCA